MLRHSSWNHWTVVVPGSHTSAAAKRGTVTKIIAEIRTIAKLCTARTRPKGEAASTLDWEDCKVNVHRDDGDGIR
ncbi:hypothetical protein IGI04_012834 [Brassica rapa subsp. trilocularis]|uniref:Uncharacterized protein n=1 Tax=Brassica rapa subsp. trilocularis TaxID=1813537 RepID=A0ABQ7N743_BRACM|nr:hypothetical protein IGI04_012834 [Brassica rapa subsp. trilocularis]